MKIMGNYITVDKNKVPIYEAIHWAKNNCTHYITNCYHEDYHGNNLINFFFIDSDQGRKEINWFVLRWA